MKFDFSKQPGLVRTNDETYTGKPFVSIITPFYNAGRYFEQTFNCVMNQTFPWFEWIIVNDGSTEAEDVKILESLAAKDFRIKVFHTANRGPAAARNYAVSRSSTDFILPVDADDLIDSVYLEQAYFALYFHPDAAWAYTDSLGFQEMQYVWQKPFCAEKLKKRNFLIDIGMIRKSLFEEAGGYDDAQKYSHEDWHLWLCLMARGGFPVHIATLSAWYRISNGGALHQTNDHREVKKRAYARIREAAKQVTQPIEAIQYPRTVAVTERDAPKRSDWKICKAKRKREVLLFVSHLGKGAYSSLNLTFIKRLQNQDCHVGLMVTTDGENSAKQDFSLYIDDLYELSAFLDISDYPEFISYYIKSRQVDAVYIHNSSYGYYIAPWLKQQFDSLQIKEFYNKKWRVNVDRQTVSHIFLNGYVAVVVESLDRGGLEQVISLLVTELIRRGIFIRVLCLRGGGLIADRLRASGVEVQTFDNNSLAFRTYIRENPPLLINTHFVKRHIRFFCKMGIPVVEVIHNMYVFFGRRMIALERKNEAYFTKLVAVSEIVKETYERRIKPSDKIIVIGNAAQLREEPKQTRSEVRKALSIPEDAYVLLNVGSIDSRKNQVGIVRAFDRACAVSAAGSSMYLVFAGNVQDEAYRAKLADAIAKCRDKEHVIVLPYYEQVRELYQMADVLVMDSYYEGWSIAATEALYDGLPVILSKCGSANELVCDGRYGRVVSHPLTQWVTMDAGTMLVKIRECRSDNLQELADAIVEMEKQHEEWAEKRSQIAREARERFSTDGMCDRYVELFETLTRQQNDVQ